MPPRGSRRWRSISTSRAVARGHVTSDNVAGAALAVRHLAELGHRPHRPDRRSRRTRRPGSIALLRLPPRARACSDSNTGPSTSGRGTSIPRSGLRRWSTLLDLPEPPTAVFAAADLMAAGAIQALSERGLCARTTSRSSGSTTSRSRALLQPALTTVRQDKQGLGAATGESLIALIEDPDATPSVVVVPVELVIRDSTAAPADLGRDRGRRDIHGRLTLRTFVQGRTTRGGRSRDGRAGRRDRGSKLTEQRTCGWNRGQGEGRQDR